MTSTAPDLRPDTDDTAPPPGAAVVATGVRRRFGERDILRGIDLRVAEGEFVALLGASGSGKTTLLRILGGLDQHAQGSVTVPDRVSITLQEPRLLPWHLVWRNVVSGLSGTDRRARALTALDEVGLAHRADALPRMLSGGEAQRVALARALVREPRLLLLDEPLAALDTLTRLRTQRLIAELCTRHQLATLLVTHNVDEALILADRAVVLREGRLARELPVDLPRPRDPGDARFAELRRQLLTWLGVHSPMSQPRRPVSHEQSPPGPPPRR